ncbi:MAG: UPF0262 family protein [Alphaproteobacteria bacterium]|nr:UPF0262 family protein [Alphaproteobacteria bacterium]
MSDSQRIAAITLDDRTVVRRSPDVEQERKVAIYDLLQKNHFAPAGAMGGPYRVRLGVEDSSLVLDVTDESDAIVCRIMLALSPFRRIIKDYFVICDSYYDAIKTATSARIEAIDMGRRGLHNEAAELLIERLEGKVDLDLDTARRLFTLLCVLHMRA